MESVEEFRRRAETWAAGAMPRRGELPAAADGEARVRQAQALQRLLFDGGFAAITWPRRYGGQELAVEHMRALDDVLAPYETPFQMLSISTGVVGPTILEVGTDEQRDTYLPRILRGDDLWVQFFSEPTGGSDLAGVTTRATRDGDTWVINGSKVWTTFGHYADYAVCLTRSDWSVQKHRGLSMFVVPVRSPGVTVVPLRQANGEAEFCQEFFDDLVLPAENLLGKENDGWSVASRVLVNERNALGGGSTWFSLGSRGGASQDVGRSLATQAARHGTWADPLVRDAVVEAHVTSLVGQQLAARVTTGLKLNLFDSRPMGSVLKLFSSEEALRQSSITLDVLGPSAVAWAPDESRSQAAGLGFLTRQGAALAGGSNEIQRNIISERVLGLPREHAPDKDQPFERVRRNEQPSGR